MKKTEVKALRLHRETLRNLDAAKLEGAVGASIPTYVEQSCAGIACSEPPYYKTRTEGTECCY